MKWLLIFFLFTAGAASAQVENDFMDHFRKSQWKSIETFHDSTLLKMEEIRLVKVDPADSLPSNPTMWVLNNEFKVKYYKNGLDSSVKNQEPNDILAYPYEYNKDKGILTIYLGDRQQTALTYRATVTSSGSFILLTRKLEKGKR